MVDGMNDLPDDAPVGPEFIENLLRELFKRAVAGTPSGEDREESGKNLAAQALAEAWRFLSERKQLNEAGLTREAYSRLRHRLQDEYRKTDRRRRTVSIQALEEQGATDSLNFLTTDGPLPEEFVNRSDLIDIVRKAIAELSETHQEVLRLRFSDGLTNKKIAEMLGISERHVIRRYQAAERAFKSAWRRLGIDPNH